MHLSQGGSQWRIQRLLCPHHFKMAGSAPDLSPLKKAPEKWWPSINSSIKCDKSTTKYDECKIKLHPFQQVYYDESPFLSSMILQYWTTPLH